MMKLRKDLTLRKVGKDHIIVEPGKGKVDMSKVYTLNETAAWVWEKLLHDEFTEETIVTLLLEEYDVTPAKAEKDASQLVNVFRKYKLLED